MREAFPNGLWVFRPIRSNPEDECAEVCHSLTDRKLIDSGGALDGEHLLPGFQFPVADLFKEWDWE
jgi:hypothetical protein